MITTIGRPKIGVKNTPKCSSVGQKTPIILCGWSIMDFGLCVNLVSCPEENSYHLDHSQYYINVRILSVLMETFHLDTQNGILYAPSRQFY
jgi:hypothetical protein